MSDRHSEVGKFADFDIDNNDDMCVIIYENHGPDPDAEGPDAWKTRHGSSGMRCYHYLHEIEEFTRRNILQRQAENDTPDLPFFGGLDPEVGKRYLTFMGGRMAWGPFDDWDAVATQLASQGYEISYSDEWAEKVTG